MTSVPQQPTPCSACQDGESLGFDFTMAFQPIVDIRDESVYAYEALVRGLDGSGAGGILAQVTDDNRYRFDQTCRVKAVELAAQLDMPCYLSINFMPNAVYQAATCIRATLQTAQRVGFPVDRLIFEVTENERVVDHGHLKAIMSEYKRQGFQTAIDDFGAGYSGLNLLAEFQPDVIKLDMDIIRDIHSHPVRQAIVRGIVGVANALSISIIAEGIESREELEFLRDLGIHLFQGYLFARPAFQRLPEVNWP